MNNIHNTYYNDIFSNIDDITPDEIAQNVTNANIKKLREFLSTGNYITEKGNADTNIICVSEKKTYNIPISVIPTFFSLLEECRLQNKYLHYAERQETSSVKQTGIMIDFDCYQLSSESQISAEVMDMIARTIAKILYETLDFVSTKRIVYHIFFINKPAVVESKYDGKSVFKDGFHMLIPEIQVNKSYKRYLLKLLQDRDILSSIFDSIEDTKISMVNSTVDIIDLMAASNPVHFFGNSKPGKPAYILKRTIKITQYRDDIDKEVLDTEKILNNRQYNLSYELSLGFYFDTIDNKHTWLKKTEVAAKNALLPIIVKESEKLNINLYDEDTIFISANKPHLKYVHQLLELLDSSYCIEYEKWFKVLCCIASCGVTIEWKNLAKIFSRKSIDKWNPDIFEAKWDEATSSQNKGHLTIGSLKFWARQCSPAKIAELDKHQYIYNLKKIAYTNGGVIEHAHVAKILSMMVGDRFVTDINASSNKKEYLWYEFVFPDIKRKHGEIYKWRHESVPENLYIYMADTLSVAYDQVSIDIRNKLEKAPNEIEQKKLDMIYKCFIKSKRNLQNNTFQEGVMKQARFRFHYRGFCEQLDTDPRIIGVGNGILILDKEPELIARYHDYKISKYTDTIYVPFDPSNKYIQKLLAAFRDIFIEDDVFEYMMCLAATGLDNCEAACILTIIVGGGQNGKTFFAKMIHNTLGNLYSAAGKSSLLTSDFEHAGSANNAQMQQKDKRWFYIDEFNKCEKLNIARVKSMVTASWQSGREIYQLQVNYKNTSNTLVLSNYDFILDCTDHGTWRRIYYYTGKSKFCANPDPNNKYEKKVDDKFINEYTNSKVYQEAMLSIMVHYYSIYLTKYGGDLQKIPVPTIINETNNFRNRQDSLDRFITQMIIITPYTTHVNITELTSKFVDWYAKNVDKAAKLSIIDIQSQLLNSRLRKMFTTYNGSVITCDNIRIRETATEPLREGEREIINNNDTLL